MFPNFFYHYSTFSIIQLIMWLSADLLLLILILSLLKSLLFIFYAFMYSRTFINDAVVTSLSAPLCNVSLDNNSWCYVKNKQTNKTTIDDNNVTAQSVSAVILRAQIFIKQIPPHKQQISNLHRYSFFKSFSLSSMLIFYASSSTILVGFLCTYKSMFSL